MSNSITTSIETYLDKTIECAKFVIDTPIIWKLKNKLDIDSNYAISFVGKSAAAAQIEFYLGGQIEKVGLTTSFDRYQCIFKDIVIDDIEDTDIRISFPIGTFYLYNMQLEHGNIATDWRCAANELPAHIHTTADITNFTSAVQETKVNNASAADFSKYADGIVLYSETAADATGDGTLALLEFTNTGVRMWNTPSLASGTYMADKIGPCVRRYENGKMLYLDSGIVDVSLMQNITLTANKLVYMNLNGYNVFSDLSASWAVKAAPFTQTVTETDQMILGLALDNSHFYLFPDNKINNKKGESGHAYAQIAYSAERLSNSSQIGGGTSAVYFTNLGVPAPIDIAAVTVNNATNASKVNDVAFGSASTMSSDAFASSSHTHTTADITSFTSAVDNRITRDKILGAISTGSVWTGETAFVEGAGTTASGQYSHAEGLQTYSNSTASHAEGYLTTASGFYSHAEGILTKATSDNAHAEGNRTTASNTNTHAEGYFTLAAGNCSHAEGYKTTVTTGGPYSHAEGANTSVSGAFAHAEGYQTTASASYTHAGGRYTIANKDAQTSIGRFNATVDSALFIVGNGSSAVDTGEVRSNAMYVTTAGNVNCVSLTQTSDERSKKDIKNLTTTDAALFNKLTPKSYTLNAEQNVKQHYGFVAQDIVAAAKEIGMPTSALGMVQQEDSEEAYYSLNYSEIVPLLVQKVKELEQRIAQLENK